MKIIVPVSEDKTSVCPSFGRAPFFSITDTANGMSEVVENKAAASEGGAGIRAAQTVLDLGAEALIAPRLGENAANVLKTAGVKLYGPKFDGVAANVGALMAGSLKPLTAIHPGFHHGGKE
jgi:predicted Fe-Mo cluster-binding NifX family protein